MRVRVALAALSTAAVLASPTVGEAQVFRTGGATVDCSFGTAACDKNWSVQWYNLGGSSPVLAGTAANAALVQDVGGIWASNASGVRQWISAIQSRSVGFSARYFFQTTFTQSVDGPVTFGIGWDNRLVGAYVGGKIDQLTGLMSGGTALLPGIGVGSPYTVDTKTAGFCRDSDGVFPSSQYGSDGSACVYNLALNVKANQANTLTFVIEGDGTTDGFLLTGATGLNEPDPVTPPGTSVPEPGSFGLLATGAALLAGAYRRRRS